jgi:MFS superfamily sulfate permease-like transporter
LNLVPTASLAALLVYTGYKLAYPKVVKELLKYGKSEVAIYLVTIGVIVHSNLLEGVLVGLALSIFKLVYAFSHLEIRLEEDETKNRTNMYLKGAATLIRLPKLAGTLDRIRPNREIHVHFEELDYIDHACLDLLTNWERQHEATGGSLVIEWDELSWKYHQRHQRQPANGRQLGADQEETTSQPALAANMSVRALVSSKPGLAVVSASACLLVVLTALL